MTFAVSDVEKNDQIPANSNHGSKIIVVPFDGAAFDGETGGSGGVGGAGDASTGGAPNTGGAFATGGQATGGTPPTGGAAPTGGTQATGGSSETGGAAAGTGGLAPAGGSDVPRVALRNGGEAVDLEFQDNPEAETTITYREQGRLPLVSR